MIEVAPIVDTPLPLLALNDSYLNIPTPPRPPALFSGDFPCTKSSRRVGGMLD